MLYTSIENCKGSLQEIPLASLSATIALLELVTMILLILDNFGNTEPTNDRKLDITEDFGFFWAGLTLVQRVKGFVYCEVK